MIREPLSRDLLFLHQGPAELQIVFNILFRFIKTIFKNILTFVLYVLLRISIFCLAI